MGLWMVRAGKRGEREDFALDKNCVLIGWDAFPDLKSLRSREAVGEAYRKAYPDVGARRMASHIGQLFRFAHEMKRGEVVALPLKRQRQVAFGVISGDYEFHPEHPPGARHVRPVDWKIKDFPRDQLDRKFLNSLQSLLSVCQVGDEHDEQAVRRIMGGESVTALTPTAGDQTDVPPPQPSESNESEDADVEQQAEQQIVDYLARKFAGHKMAEIVDAILRAQGYVTEVSPPGPDGGVDIIAGRGPLGFDRPRLVAQVKGGGGAQDVKVLRELKGVMQDFNAEQGLFVSWGDFKRSVHAESRRNFFNIRLWNADDILKGIQSHYDQFPDELKAELPLKRVWTLVPDVS
jgi:restriction system protein